MSFLSIPLKMAEDLIFLWKVKIECLCLSLLKQKEFQKELEDQCISKSGVPPILLK